LYYETIFIVNPDISQENTEKLTDNLIARVEKAGGRIVKREYWGVRQLAYAIAKRKRGHYVLLVTDGEARAIRALEEGIHLEESVLRFLTTRLTELSDEPSPLLRRKPETSASDKDKSEEEPAAEKVTDTEAVAEKAAEEEPRVEEAAADEKAEATEKKAAGKSEEKADA